MAARPLRRAPDPLPAAVPIGGDYLLALWSDRRPRIYAPASPPQGGEGRTRGLRHGRAAALEVRARLHRGRWTLRLSVDGRQVTRSLLAILAEHAVTKPRRDGLILHSVDGTCAPRSLVWMARGDLVRAARWGRYPEDGAAMRPAKLRAPAAAACRANDALVSNLPDV